MSRKTEKLVRVQPWLADWESENWVRPGVEIQFRNWKKVVGLQPTPVLLPGKSHGQRSLVGCSPWGHEELDTTE